MATYTITLTAEQDAALATLITRTNAARAAQKPTLPAITVNEYVQSRATEIASNYAAQIKGEDEAAVLAAYKAATAAKQGSVKTTLGVA